MVAVLDVVLIPLWGLNGAGIASAIAYLCMGAASGWAVQRVEDDPPEQRAATSAQQT